MRRFFPLWLSACLIAILSIQICSAALPQNGAHDFDEFSAQEPQPIVPNTGKTTLTRNRVSNRAIAPNVAIPRSNPQLKSHLLQQKPAVSSTQPPQAETEPEPEANNVPKSGTEEEAGQPNEEVSSSAAPSTEPTRKPLLNGRIRPFQSNREFLERLRRRQEQQRQHGYTVVPPTSPATSTEKLITKSNTRKAANVSPKVGIPSDQFGHGSQKKSTSSRRYNGKANSLTSTTPLTLANEAEVEESSPVTQTTRSRLYPKTNRRIS